jgi:type VI secretion system protein ImpF
MARTELERSVQQSLLDRLTDDAPKRPNDPVLSRDETARLYRIAVQRDVEWLLNTRRSIIPVPAECRELRRSVHEFGLPDTTGLAVATPDGRDTLVASIREALDRFEPRLINVKVRLVEADQIRTPQVRFSIEATLRMDPSPEQVVFDTVLEVASGTFAVEDENAVHS